MDFGDGIRSNAPRTVEPADTRRVSAKAWDSATLRGGPEQSRMRTVLVTNGNLLSLLSLGGFLRAHYASIAAVFLTTRLPSQRSNVAGVLNMWRKSGWRYTHFKLLTNVLLPRRLSRHGLPTTVAAYLRHLGAAVPVIEVPDINRPELVDQVRSYAPEILLSFSATTRFHDTLLAVPSRAALNAHYALLPGYAGLSPYFWYLRNQEPVCGVTLHRIISRLDAGPIIEQQRFSMVGLRTVLSVVREQTARISPMLCRYYDGTTSENNAVQQDLAQRSYFRHPTRADVAALHQRGFGFYDHEDIAHVAARLESLTGSAGVRPAQVTKAERP
jgi:methionyl-tRNA formyltransferase